MPSYIYRRQLAPSQTRESLDEVRARLIEELRLRTEERVNYWNQLGDWCGQRPGRYIGVDWRPNLRTGNLCCLQSKEQQYLGSSSSATSATNNIVQGRSVVETNSNFEFSAELENRTLNEFWDLWDVQKELLDLIEIENSKEKSVVEQPD
jgi:hypothetical protein